MDVAHVGLVHRDPCECKVKGFCAVSSIERNVSKRRHLQGVRQSERKRTPASVSPRFSLSNGSFGRQTRILAFPKKLRLSFRRLQILPLQRGQSGYLFIDFASLWSTLSGAPPLLLL